MPPKGLPHPLGAATFPHGGTHIGATRVFSNILGVNQPPVLLRFRQMREAHGRGLTIELLRCRRHLNQFLDFPVVL
jgi:hypothetical protein